VRCLRTEAASDGAVNEASYASPKNSPPWRFLLALSLTIGAFSVVVLFLIVRPRTGVTFDGLVYIDATHGERSYQFFPNAQTCPPRGIDYLLEPNDDLVDQMTFRPGHYIQGAWHAKFKGDLSSIGFYGRSENYWRELSVTDVYEVTDVDCGFK